MRGGSAQREDGYEHRDFVPGEMLRSPLFPDLELAVDRIFSPPLVEELMQADREAVDRLKQQITQERERADRLAELLRERGLDRLGIEP